MGKFVPGLGDVFLDFSLLPGEFLVADLIPVAHPGQVVELALKVRQFGGQAVVYGLSAHDFFVVGIANHPQGPVLEFRQDVHVLEYFHGLAFKLFVGDAGLMAFDVGFLPSAMIVGVFAPLLCALDELVLGFSRDGAAAMAALHHAGESEFVLLRSRLAFFAKNFLHAVELLHSNHGRVLALVNLVLMRNQSGIEHVIKKQIKPAHGHRTIADSLLLQGPESPFVVKLVQYLRHRVVASKNQVPGSPDKREALRVDDYGMVSRFVQIAERRHAWPPAFVELALDAAFNIFAQFLDELVGHAAFYAEEQGVIVRPVRLLVGLDAVDYPRLEHPLQLAAVHRIAG